MRNWRSVLCLAFLAFLALPGALYGQEVPVSQCVYWLGDTPAWTPADATPASAKPYSEYRMTGDATVVWVRCRTSFDTSFDTKTIQHPAIAVDWDTSYETFQVYVDGQWVKKLGYNPIFPVPPDSARPLHTIDVRVLQRLLISGLTPGRLVYVYTGDETAMQEATDANVGDTVRNIVPVYSVYLAIGVTGLFLLGLFLFDRSQKAAFWLGVYCCCIFLPRYNTMHAYLVLFDGSILVDGVVFALGMFESWALVRVNFALARRRVPAIYWLVPAAWVFLSVGSILPPILPVRWALPLSLFVQVTCFKPIWCIWAFACTAPFVAFWPSPGTWTRLRSRLGIVAALCAVWAVIEGWFQLQQVIVGRGTWSGDAQNWMSAAIAAVVIALLGYIFHEQTIAAGEQAEMRGELSAARQVQRLLVPARMNLAPGVSVSAAFLPAHEVGGDFYLCRALPSGAQRVLLGDVSGKGVAAALTSALLLGAADRCDDLGPALVLRELNATLRNSGIGGFTTCLCADLAPSGVLRIANAGQLPPYCNGSEVELLPGLPLGIAPVADYSESAVQLAPGDALTFLSDGVVEARNAGGELFGFERTLEISARPAQQIAEAAVRFGQQDDITVLTLSLALEGTRT